MEVSPVVVFVCILTLPVPFHVALFISMRSLSASLALLVQLVSPLCAQVNDTVYVDNGNPAGVYSSMPAGSEESVILQPSGPAKIVAVRIYLAGQTARRDTIWVVGDPSEGAIPPTAWTWGYNWLIRPFVVNYSGSPGWVTLNTSAMDLRSDGFDRIVVQHRIQASGGSGGPWFVIDSDSARTPYSSFLMNPGMNNSLGFPGVYYLTQGDFMVRLVVQYDRRAAGGGSEEPPAPSLVDATDQVGLVDGTGNVLKGSRASVADWNRDGWDDIALGSKFYQNRGDGAFQDVTGSIGIVASASVWGDFDNDGYIDCYAVNGGASDRLYRNNRDGSFSDVTAGSGITNPYPTITPIWIDYDHDGNLDLFISNGRTESGGQETYYPDQLWRSNGDGSFSNVTASSGIAEGEPTPLDCWGAAACDYNRDGWTDLFVATYRLAPDLFYVNRKGGRYEEVGATTGLRGMPTADPGAFGHGIGCEWADFNNDGRPDVAIGNLGHPDWRGQFSNPSLIYRNNIDGSFSEVHHEMGVKFFEMNSGVLWLDLDLDGVLDLWHCQYAYQAAGGGEPRRLSRMYLGGGEPEGWRMHDRTWELGSIIHGAWTAVRADFDNDGDLDIVAASPTDAIRYFRNDVVRRGRWLKIRLRGDDDHTIPYGGVGTNVDVYAGGRLFHCGLDGGGGGATASQNSNELHFGLGNVSSIDSVVINYPNSALQVRKDLQPDNAYVIDYAETGVSSTPAGGTENAWSMRAAWERGGFVIEFSDLLPQDMEIEVFAMDGRCVARGTGRGGARIRIEGHDVTSGVYIVNGRQGGRIWSERVVVAR